MSTKVYLFTLIFSGGKRALLNLYCSTDTTQEEAEKCAASLLQCCYVVLPGDHTEGWAAIFYSWTSGAAQEGTPAPRPCEQSYEEATQS